jgi:Ca2+-transporting ATPase
MVPSQKLELVKFYQKHNAIVGMIGDGVNDAPALKKADIGIAMGIRGTQAAKEVSDVILIDDKFTSTELAIRQGRTIYENIRHFVVYLLSCNLAEIIAVSLASLSKLPLPLLPLQILFLNLVTDVFPALALGMGKGDSRIMEQPPRSPDEPIIPKKLWVSTFVYGLSITGVVLGVTIYGHLIKSWQYEVVNNMAFYTLILAQLVNVFNMPHRQFSFFKNEVTSNPWIWIAIALSLLIIFIAYHITILQTVLSLVPLSYEQFITVWVFGMSSLVIIQSIKRLGGTV